MRFIGINLTANPRLPSGYAVIDNTGNLLICGAVYDNPQIYQLINEYQPHLVAIGAPTNAPAGHDLGYGLRTADLELSAMGCIPQFPAKVLELTWRGIALANWFDSQGVLWREVNPASSMQMLGSSTNLAFERLGRYLDDPQQLNSCWASQPEAVAAAATALLDYQGKTRRLGNACDGWVTIPISHCIKAVIFDLDGTLTPVCSIWQYLHECHNTWESHGQPYLQLFSEGKITYQQFVDHDASAWLGSSRSIMEEMAGRISLRPGVSEMALRLRQAGIKLALVSSGLDLMAARVAQELQFNCYYCNQVEFTPQEKVSGTVTVQVDWHGKGQILPQVCQQLGVKPYQLAVVGDSAGDVCMFPLAGLAVAFNPTEAAVANAADFVVVDDDATKLLELLLDYIE